MRRSAKKRARSPRLGCTRTAGRSHKALWMAEPADRADKRATRSQKQRTKALKRQIKAEEKRLELQERGEGGRVTAGNAKKVIAVARVVVPVLAPFALRASVAVRAYYDRMRARRLGVPVDDLGRFTGKGAALHARIAGDRDALRDIRTQTVGRSEEEVFAVDQYAEETDGRLGQLASAVRAAERMPAQRRRAAHRAIDGELKRLEGHLLRRLGV
ncbi:hypothetical protein A8924_0471 [Saccharopolyspora erythraea NRRL 2338]|uniref:Uncharacterized protein n=2 Tax=Saccharopolyspora erythraea TaxID=1836 RepID=A4F5W5_SACEN|nr:DUF6474 family protein [Saccharopolyspora erythraea]EQD84217.1 hypothetical protein N599_21230 [Saccharopolyspora erythraea D]PFG93238.1 hypothetical protein A8924_0471 [Saccharopolyspora erythraea NRRL 2338]QRK90091.1 hypothetical protein JQX30_00425 [Saccharopolyspora erythraea]CAL99439.1 hypothetical protein SACE_0086 [Saccharopolyspora erythraea NRRL 2338]